MNQNLVKKISHISNDNTLYVFTDYFDTLVWRTINPEDVKKIWAARISLFFNLNLSENELYDRRVSIEAALCQENMQSGHDLEFSVINCYKRLWNELETSQNRPTLERFLEVALDTELSIECSVQVLHQDVLEYLKDQAHSGRKLILISDFYFPAVAFRQMLRHHKLEELFTQVFVSCDFSLTKRSGRLYKKVLNVLNTVASECCMIGDNAESDVNQARIHGIDAIHLDRHFWQENYQKQKQNTANMKLLEQNIWQLLTRQGSEDVFPGLSLTLYTFIECLHARLVMLGYRDVFFLAREGQFIKAMFDHYQVLRGYTNTLNIRSHYLEVSRRATFMPSLGPLERETFEILFRQYRRISVHEFLLNLGLEDYLDQLEVLLPQHDLRTRIDDLPVSLVFKDLLACQLFREKYDCVRNSGRKAFLSYFDNFARVEHTERACLVDVGWKGTIQDNLFNLFNLAAETGEHAAMELDGLYVGLVAPGMQDPNNRKEGLLFSSMTAPNLQHAVFNENRALFEVVLGASHGSAAKYIIDETGKSEVIHDVFEEEILFHKLVNPLQERLFNLFEDLTLRFSSAYYGHERLMNLAIKVHTGIVFAPSQEEIDWFSNVYHVENFGVFEHSEFESKNARARLLYQLAFWIELMQKQHRVDLGFWPWLSCRQRGGRLMGTLYLYYRLGFSAINGVKSL